MKYFRQEGLCYRLKPLWAGKTGFAGFYLVLAVAAGFGLPPSAAKKWIVVFLLLLMVLVSSGFLIVDPMKKEIRARMSFITPVRTIPFESVESYGIRSFSISMIPVNAILSVRYIDRKGRPRNAALMQCWLARTAQKIRQEIETLSGRSKW